MNLLNSIFAYSMMAGVTLGLMSIPHAVYYEHPRLIFAHWIREDLRD